VNTLAKYRYSKSSSPFDDAKKMYIIIGICALVVIIGLVLCLTLQGGQSPDDIPVVEQGDGTVDIPDQEPGGETTSMGDLIIDDGSTPVTEFEVTVTGADGTYLRSEGSSEASITITGQNTESFAFDLTVGQASTSDTAYFNGARSAICEKADGALLFSFEAEGVLVTTDGTVSELSSPADGIYILSEASTTTPTTTTTTSTTPAGNTVYDLDLIKSESTRNTLSSMMSSQEYNLVRDLLDAQGGYGIIYGTGDKAKEKQGRSFNLDSQTNGVMYYSFESGTGRETVVICTGDGKVYVGLCDGSEYRYFSNDPARSSASDAPNTIVQYAKIKNMTLS